MLDGHSAVVWQGNIYIWGGKDESPSTSTRTAQSFYNSTMYMMNANECINPNAVSIAMSRVPIVANTSSNGGGNASTTPRGRAYHTATVYGKYIFILGGLMDESTAPAGGAQQQESNNNVIVPVFDLEARTWSFKSTFGDVPCARCHHVAVLYGDCIMVHGGYPVLPGGQQKELTSEEMASMQHAMFDVHELNLTTLRWRRISTSQSPALWGHTAVAFNKNVIVFGGVDVVENSETGAVAVWHQEKKLWRWADFQNLELRCAMHTAVVDGSRMLVYGGVSFKQQKKIRTLFEFNLEFGTWRELTPRGQQPPGRIGHAAVTFQQHMIVIGGAAEGSADGGEGGLAAATTKFDRRVYVYSSQSNDWHSLAVVSNNDPAMLLDDGGAGDGASGRLNPGSAAAAWSINKSTTAGRDADASSEWDNTATRVRETLTRAKAIQQLADTAADALTRTSYGGGVPADGSGDPNQSIQRLQRQSDPNTPYEYYRPTGGPDQVVTNSDESRRVIEHLSKENDKLRQQLDEFRSLSMGNNKNSNPYEVPVYNTSSAVLPENESLASPGRARAAGRLEGSAALSELAPRLNINVAEPPRAVGTGASGPSGYMSRGAVSALVNASIRDQPASTSLAANLRAAASLDPMSYLTQTPHVTALQNTTFGQTAIPGSYQAPRSYEQLLSRSNIQPTSHSMSSTTFGAPQQYALPTTGDMPQIPNSLRPLLSILTGGHIPGTSIPAAANASPMNQRGGQMMGTPQYGAGAASPSSQQLGHMGASHMAAYSQQQAAQQALDDSFHNNSMSAYQSQQAAATRASRTPSLARLVSGQGSMLSLSMLK